MNIVTRSLGITLIALASTTTYAKTFKYDLVDVHSSNGYINYPGLNFNEAKSAVLTVNKDPLSPDVQISSLEVSFPNAAKLLATDFKRTEFGTYRAVVNDAWIYRQVIVEIRDTDFNYTVARPVSINVSVSEKSEFIRPENAPNGHPLFNVEGMLRDITTNNVIDTVSATIDGKRVTLSLKENLSFATPNSQVNGPREGFVIDVLWTGRGQKTLYIPAPVPPTEFDRFTAVGIVLEEFTIPSGKEYTFSIRFIDAAGSETQTPFQPLKPRLNEAFN